ncbi:MAG: TRAP transporter small permease subunit [Dehalococcoidales bacterium]|nr:TRAP transporter small permease subunit [Dehalococcoidales bacterium]
MKSLKKFATMIDNISEKTGIIGALLVIPLMLIVFVDVVLRYIFNSPLVWAWDINVQLSGLVVILGMSYTLRYGGHIIIDVFVMKLSPRGRAIMDICTSPLFFAAIAGLTWRAVLSAVNAIVTGERYSSFFRPPLAPFRILMVFGLALLFCQGLSKFIKDVSVIISPAPAAEIAAPELVKE